MLKDIFGSLGFVIVGSDILFWAYFFIMDKVSVFESSDFGELRIIVDPKGDVWFVASDVAKSLGYINAKDAVKRHVDDDDSAEDPAYQKYVDTYGYHFSNALADEAVKKMVNVDGSKRIWKQPEIKDIFEKCGAKKPDKATWGDVQYVFAMYYSDGFPKVFKCENELVKATLMYLDDPDAPEGVAFIRWLAVQDYLGEKINWKDLT